jgi:DNA-binding transcriptional LysR family regulator
MLDLLETFIAVSEAGSLNKAAEALHLTQPAITRQIRSLEAQLGAVLLTRSSHGVTLTPAGVAILPHARQALAASAACKQAAQAASAGRAQRLTLATGLMITLYVLPPVIARFRELHPDVDVALHPGLHAQAVDRLLNYEVDAAVIGSDVDVPQVRAIPIFRDPLLLVTAPSNAAPVSSQALPLSSGAQLGISEATHAAPPQTGHGAALAALQGAALHVPSPQTGLRHQIERALADRGITATLHEHPIAETIKTAVALGMGVAILPRSVVVADVAAGRLHAVPLDDWPDAYRTVRVLIRAEGAVPTAVRALIGLLQERYA